MNNMNTQSTINNIPVKSGYVSYPSQQKTFGKLNPGDKIYKIIIDNSIISTYEIIDIRDFTDEEIEIDIKNINKANLTYSMFNDYPDDSFRAYKDNIYEYKRGMIGKNTNVVYFINENGLNECLNKYIEPVINKINIIKEKFQNL